MAESTDAGFILLCMDHAGPYAAQQATSLHQLTDRFPFAALPDPYSVTSTSWATAYHAVKHEKDVMPHE